MKGIPPVLVNPFDTRPLLEAYHQALDDYDAMKARRAAGQIESVAEHNEKVGRLEATLRDYNRMTTKHNRRARELQREHPLI